MYRANRKISLEEATHKLMRYCAYQERCSQEIKTKAKQYGLSSNQINDILAYLKDENFINEQRFAESYVRGKAKVKRWGYYKIRAALRAKSVEEKVIETALTLLNDALELENLRYWLERKIKGQELDFEGQQKVFQYLQRKGFKSDQIQQVMKEKGLLK
jgi:regulatory protein